MRKIFFGWLKESRDKRKIVKENKRKMAAQDIMAHKKRIEDLLKEGGAVDCSYARRDEITYVIRGLQEEINELKKRHKLII